MENVLVVIICQKSYAILPNINNMILNSGVGAIFRPIMTRTKRIVSQELVQSVDCIGNYPSAGD